MTALIIGGFDAPSSRSPALGGPWDYYGFRRTGHKKLAELCRLPRHDPRGKITSAFGAKGTREGPTAASNRSRMTRSGCQSISFLGLEVSYRERH